MMELGFIVNPKFYLKIIISQHLFNVAKEEFSGTLLRIKFVQYWKEALSELIWNQVIYMRWKL